jgi:glucosylceramidase
MLQFGIDSNFHRINYTMNPIDHTRVKISQLTLAAFAALLSGHAGANGPKPPTGAALEGKTISVYTTARGAAARMAPGDTLTFEAARQPLETETAVFVNPGKRFQTMLGIGGAITDASAEVFSKLSPAKQDEFIAAYYDKDKGIGYSLARTTIHSSDFSSGSYTYVAEGDKALSTFSLEHDRQYRIPMIRKALAAAGGMKVFVSPWSAPAFMKDNKHMLRGGKLLPEYRDAWARYFAKFIKGYEAEGIPVWGLTVQNEPMATQKWESMIFTAEEERDFLRDHLGPVMHAAGLGGKKIIVWDHNRDLMPHRAAVIFGDPRAAKYAWGMGFHWYETWAGGAPMYANVNDVHQAFPDKHLMLTEATVEKFDPERYQHWPNAERYGSAMINDLNFGTVGWTDWNVLLDERGGPNHVSNFCFAPIHADTRTGELIYTPSYYYIGHFSKFIRPGAQRVSSTASRSTLLTTSFRNPDGRMATVVMNEGDKEIAYILHLGQAQAKVSIPAHAIQTLLY